MKVFIFYLDDNDGATAHLAWLAFLIDFAQTGPFAEFLVRVDADQWNLMFVAQGGDEFLVLWLVTAFGQNAQNSLSLVQSLACLMDAMHHTVGNQRLLQHFLQGGVNVHWAAAQSWCWCRYIAERKFNQILICNPGREP